MKIDDIKCAEIKFPPDTRMFPNDMTYAEMMALGDNIYLENGNTPKTDLGYILGLKADYFVYNTWNEDKYKEYDIILVLSTPLDTIREKFRPDQLFLYTEAEPPCNSKETWGYDWDIRNTVIKKPYDYYLNFYVMDTGGERNIMFPTPYDLDFFDRIKLKSQKVKNKIFLQKRGVKGKRAGGWEYAFPSQYTLVNESSGYVAHPYNYVEHLCNLNTCSYSLSNDWTDSAGQITAESCLLDVISFAPPHKLFTKLLLPEYCWFTTTEDALKKIEELESNPSLKKEILSKIQWNVKKLDPHVFERDILKLYEKFVKNGYKV